MLYIVWQRTQTMLVIKQVPWLPTQLGRILMHVKIRLFLWNVMPCCLVDRYQHFRGTLVPTYQHPESKNPENKILIFTTKKTSNCTNSTNCCIKGTFWQWCHWFCHKVQYMLSPFLTVIITTFIIIIKIHILWLVVYNVILAVLHNSTYLCTMYQLYRRHIPCIFRRTTPLNPLTHVVSTILYFAEMLINYIRTVYH